MELRANFAEKVQTLRGQIAQKKTLAVVASMLVILFSAGLIYSTLSGHTNAAPTAPQPPTQAVAPVTGDGDTEDDNGDEMSLENEQVEVLPRVERMDDEPSLKPMDPFAAPPLLVGVLLGGGGDDIAIIEAGGKTFIVKTGEMIAGLWKVAEIHKDRVVISIGGQQTILSLGR